MSIFSRFFGQSDAEAKVRQQLVANSDLENAPCFGVLISTSFTANGEQIQKRLRQYHSSMGNARFEVDENLKANQIVMGLVGWDKHVIKIVGFDFQMPPDIIENCVSRCRYSPEIKANAASHKSHILLYYAGYETDHLEQYVALAAVAGVLASFGAIVVINESCQISLPTSILANETNDENIIDNLRTLPLPMLYCGFVQYNMEDTDSVWFRTLGANYLGLPDFAAFGSSYEEGSRYFELFSNIFSYLMTSKAVVLPGHTMQLGQDKFLSFNSPTESQYYLESDGQMLVLETISADQIARP